MTDESREATEFAAKTEINKRVQARYNDLMREGKHGHYETLFRVVHEQIDDLRARLAAFKPGTKFHTDTDFVYELHAAFEARNEALARLAAAEQERDQLRKRDAEYKKEMQLIHEAAELIKQWPDYHTVCAERDAALTEAKALRERVEKLEGALRDAIAGLHYVREHYHDERTASGDLYGVDFDRVDEKALAALDAKEKP